MRKLIIHARLGRRLWLSNGVIGAHESCVPRRVTVDREVLLQERDLATTCVESKTRTQREKGEDGPRCTDVDQEDERESVCSRAVGEPAEGCPTLVSPGGAFQREPSTYAIAQEEGEHDE